MARVVLAMSGGVDSSVAAHLLQEQGHDVIGVFMRHGEQSPLACDDGESDQGDPLRVVTRPDHKQGCCTASDAADARRVADRLDIPFYALNLQQEFSRIIDYFVDQYLAARTPNPCVMCNNWIKFGKLFDYADSVAAEFVATGHYARLTRGRDGAVQLRRGRDLHKDQSYALAGISVDLLPRMMLPVGEYEKPHIRLLAGRLGLRVAEKRDSQEICFTPPGRHADFVRARTGNRDTGGELVTVDGQVVGRHEGIERFTIGQRKGLGVALGQPRYVVRIDAGTHQVVLGEKQDLAQSELTADGANWLVSPPAQRRCLAQIRYNSAAQPATVTALPDDRLHAGFDEPQFGVAPGQAVVCYDEDCVLGSGWIE